MTIISKATAYPKSVRSGIPKLGKKPDGWLREPLSKHLREVPRPIVLEDDFEYRLVTVKRSRGGVVEREVLAGRNIAVKSQFALKSGDFLISKRQIVHGACGVVPADLDGTVVSNEYSVLNGVGTIDLEFLKYLSHSSYFQETCFHSSIGVHVEKMIFNLDRWLKWPFDLPPIKEQRRIAEILLTWDKAFAVQEKLVANAKTHKTALMQQLLTGKKRLPGFKGEWKKKRFGDVLALRIGGTPSRNNMSLWDQDKVTENHWVAISDLKGKYIFETKERISDEGVRRSNVKLLPADTVIMSFKLSIGTKAILKQPSYTNEAICALLPLPGTELESLYVYHALECVDLEETVDQAIKGKTLNKAKITELSFFVPERAEQCAIVGTLETQDRELELQQRRLSLIASEKSALMQQLLTGKRRVKVEAVA